MAGINARAHRANPAGPFWPFSVRTAVLTAPVLLAVFLIFLGIVRASAHWPDRRLDGWLLFGMAALSLVPLFLVLLGSVAGGGGSLEAFGVKLRWVEAVGIAGHTVSPTLGIAQPYLDQPLSFTDSVPAILATLREATSYSVAVVDLGDGQEWLETRLFLLSAGAAQSGRPAAIVFVATEGGVHQAYQGWATPAEIVRGLISANPDFAPKYEQALTAARQWELAAPPVNANSLATLPWNDPKGPGSSIAFEGQRRNKVAFAGFLAETMTDSSANQDHISVVRLAALFAPFLRKMSVDASEHGDAWVSTVLGTTDPYLAMTQRRRYLSLVPREAALNDILSALTGRTA